MFQVTCFPAAFHEFAHVAFSPSIFIYAFVDDISLSKAFAVTFMVALLVKRLAVSLTTAKAAGRISSSSSATSSSDFVSNLSISVYNFSFSSMFSFTSIWVCTASISF
jgi:hypothetical protein